MKTDRPDVLVIGGGVVGLFSALFLRRAGFHVLLVEAGAIAGSQSSSYGNTGYVGTTGSMPLAEPSAIKNGIRWLFTRDSPLYIQPRPSADLLLWLWRFYKSCNEQKAREGFRVLFEMKRRSLDILRELCGASALSSCFADGGKLIAFRTESAFRHARDQAVRMNNLGMQLEVLSAADVQALEPNAFKTIAGALFNRDDACLHVPDFVAALANTAKSEGVEISEHTPVRNITRDGNVLRVKTSAGDVFPKTVVVACGAWSGKVLAPLGIHLGQQPAKGYSITMRTPDAAPKRPVLLSEGRVAVTPLGEKIRFAGILDLVGMNTALSRERLDAVLRTVGSYVNIGKGEVVEEWAGLRSCTPDGIPSIGRIPSHPDIIVACGHGHIGMGLAPVTGRLVAQIAAGDEPEMDLRPLAIDRFQRRAA